MDKITHKVRCEQWTNIIKECLASGMPKTTWCREHGISDKSFFYWQRILREEAYLTTLESTLAPAVKENPAPTTCRLSQSMTASSLVDYCLVSYNTYGVL